MDGGEVAAERRPLQECLGPVLALDNVLGLILFVVPEDANVVATVHDKLITATASGVLEEPFQVFTLLEGRDLGGDVVFADASFGAISLNIANLVDAEGVLLIEGDIVEGANGGGSLAGGGVFDKGESRQELAGGTGGTARTTQGIEDTNRRDKPSSPMGM